MDINIKHFTNLLTCVAEKSMVKTLKNKQNVWWNQELKKLKTCIKTLKVRANKYLKKIKRATLVKNVNKNKIEYQICKNLISHISKEYRNLILDRKAMAWEQTIKNSKVWDTPYKILTNKYQKLEMPMFETEKGK